MLNKTNAVVGAVVLTGLIGVGVLAFSGAKDPDDLLMEALISNDCYLSEDGLVALISDHDLTMDTLETVATTMAQAGQIELQSEGLQLLNHETCSGPTSELIRYAEQNNCRLADDPFEFGNIMDDFAMRYGAQAAEEALSELITSGQMTELFELTSGTVCGS